MKLLTLRLSAWFRWATAQTISSSDFPLFFQVYYNFDYSISHQCCYSIFTTLHNIVAMLQFGQIYNVGHQHWYKGLATLSQCCHNTLGINIGTLLLQCYHNDEFSLDFNVDTKFGTCWQHCNKVVLRLNFSVGHQCWHNVVATLAQCWYNILSTFS